MEKVILIRILCCLAIVLFTRTASAGGKFVEIVLPNGNSNINLHTGFGGAGFFEITIDPKATFVVEFGLLILRGKQVSESPYGQIHEDYSGIVLPIQTGVRYYIGGGDSRLFIGGLIGFHDFIYDNSSSKSVALRKSAASVVGYQISAFNGASIELAARYQFVGDDFSYLGIGAGLAF